MTESDMTMLHLLLMAVISTTTHRYLMVPLIKTYVADTLILSRSLEIESGFKMVLRQGAKVGF